MIWTDKIVPFSATQGPSRRRLLWAAITGSGMLSGIYWTFPPIFADSDSSLSKVVEPGDLVQTASLSALESGNVRSLPDIPLTPSIETHRRSIALLEEGLRRLKEVPGYTAEFSKQEVVDGVLTDPQRMRMKVRHAPFSVYMKWIEGKPGQELLYVDGQNDGEIVVRPGGLKGRILGAIKLNPHGAIALGESRHPITQAGLMRLAEKILSFRYNESGWLDGYRCIGDEAEVGGRPCHRFAMVYDSPNIRREYRKSVIYIDREWLVPTKVENFGWPSEDFPADRLDAETLLESYCYTKINLETQLAAVDFNVANTEYSLRRR